MTLLKTDETLGVIRKATLFQPEVGIILGTGLGGLVEDLELEHSFEYSDLPHFAEPTVESHSGKLLFGALSGRRVVVMQGRFHYYEGYSLEDVTYPVRILKRLGIRNLIISNAAGGLDPLFSLSDLMIIEDHINLIPGSPLRGTNVDEFGPRFPDMSKPYSAALNSFAEEVALEHGFNLRKGVYAAVSGPHLETPAEYRYLRTIGADAVGMSTVPENIVASHMGLPCFAVSVITDLCNPESLEKVTVEKVIAAALKAEPQLRILISGMVSKL